MEIRLDYKGSVYSFCRDSNGVGAWYCVNGKVPGSLSSRYSGIAVPSALASELIAEAVRCGLATVQDLSKHRKKQEKQPKRVRVAELRPKTVLRGGFNPFEMPSISEQEAEATLALEALKAKVRSRRMIDEDESPVISDLFADETTDEESAEDVEFEIEEIEPEIIGD